MSTNVIQGPEPLETPPETSFGQIIYDSLLNSDSPEALVEGATLSALSYSDLLRQSCALAQSLRLLGFGKDSVFGICSENSPQYLIPVISSLFMGAIIAPLNPTYTETELRHTLGITNPSIVFCSKTSAEKLSKIAESVIVIDGDYSGLETLEEFTRKEVDVRNFHVSEVDPNEQIAFVLPSSGTTGLPKGVGITHKNFVVCSTLNKDSRVMNNPSNGRVLALLPFFHAFGLLIVLLALIDNLKIVVLRKFEAETFLKAVSEFKIETLYLAPPLVLFLAKTPLVEKYDLSQLKEILSGAAPLSKGTEDLVKKRLNLRKVGQGYGLTEMVLSLKMPVEIEKSGSVGKVLPFMSCKVRDLESGGALPPHEVGELCFKGPIVMKGYFGDPEATERSFTPDGWFLTGDLGYYDEEGFFFIVGRLKELIKYKGHQVAPAELEAVLLSDPRIRDAGVVGVPRGDLGELPLALVVKHPDVELTEKEVEDFVAESVAPYKRLRGGVVFVEEIPKTPSGKILRRELRRVGLQDGGNKN